MSTDSTYQDKLQRQEQAQGSVPSSPQPGMDEPMINPDDPGKYDPLTTPDPGVGARPEGWDEQDDGDMPEADEQTPLSDDRR